MRFGRKDLLFVLVLPVISCVHQVDIPLDSEWRFKTGDNAEWSKLDYKDINWSSIEVPKNLAQTNLERTGGYVWYRTTYTLGREISELTSLQLGIIGGADETYVDGLLIGSTGRFPPHGGSTFHRMRTYLLPLSALSKGNHLIAVRIYTPGGPGVGILRGPLGLSPYALAQQQSEMHRFFRSDLLVASALATLLIGIYHFFIWAFRRRENQHLAFSGLALSVAVYMFGASFRPAELFLSHLSTIKLLATGSIFGAYFLLRFVRSSMRKPMATSDRVAVSVTFAACAFVLIQQTHFQCVAAYNLWMPVLITILAYTGQVFYRHLKTQHGLTAWAIVAPFFALILSILHDIRLQLFDVSGTLLNPYAFTFFVLGITYFLAKGYSRALVDQGKKNEFESENLALRDLANTDELTSLANRRLFERQLQKEIQRAKRYGNALSLTLVDVDRFKQYNDRFGHPAGDRVLRETAWIIREAIRTTDVGARIGGDEFALILPETNDEDAVALSRRLRALVESFPFEHSFDNDPVSITVSIGIAHLSDQTTSFESLVEAADKALYRAKEFRNTVFSTTFSGPDRSKSLSILAKIIPLRK